MFNIITQRLLWKEFRAQQLVWIAIAGELVLLQFWWGIKGHEYADVNLFSMAFVLTGVFAMTTSALLFAGESEAKTDLFLRQLPITPRQLIGGKLLYGGLAVVAFLVFAMLSTLIAGQMAGKYGGDSSSLMGDPSVFALSIVGLAAWGLYYSLLTRKVLWTVIGAALTEIIIGGIVHSILAGYHLPDSIFYSIYTVIVLGVLAVDAKLLLRWCAGEVADQQTDSGSRLDDQMLLRWPTSTAVNAAAPVATIALLWQTTFHSSWITGVVTTLYGLLLIILLRISDGRESITGGESLLLLFGAATILAIITVFAVSGVRRRSAPGGTNFTQRLFDLPLTLRSCGSLLGMAGLAVGGFVLGIVASYTILAIPVGMMFINHGVGRSPMWAEMLWFLLMAVGSSFTLWVGTQWLKTGQGAWLPLLQQSHSIRSRTVRRIGPLLWIEARRALPVLLGGWVLLTLIGWYRPEMPGHSILSYSAIVFAALVCGLLTLLPDRSHGTLAFLTERGVSSTKIMLSKVFIWGGTLLLMLIPPLLQGRVWGILDPHGKAVPIAVVLDGPLAAHGPFIQWESAPSPWSHLLVLLLGTFTIGVLAAAWVRRPILAGIVGFSLMLPWFGWSTMLMETYAPIGFTALVPIVLIGLGIFWTGSRTILEQSSWRSKFGQIAWVLLVGFIGLQGYFHFRANEVPVIADYEVMQSIRNGQPSPLGNPVSSWKYPFDPSISHASQLDALVDDETKRNSLVQPAGLWNAPNSFQMGIESLKLDEEACDLDAAFEHLRKWHELTEKLAYASRDEDGWVDALVGRRVVLSAIRKWANHPKQTAERVEAVLTKLTPNQIGLSGMTVIARQYADTRRSLETGISTDNMYRQSVANISPVTRWLLARTGEKERVRRLIDYYFLLSAGSQISQPSTTGSEFDHWTGTIRTRVCAATLGVSLPEQRFNVRHHGQFELAMSSESATRLVLQLQSWRLKHGTFPASFAEVFQETGPLSIHDFLTNAAFHYEPQGFDRDLLAETKILIPARQPLLYSEGLTEPRGVELVDVPRGPWPPDDPSTVTYQYQARNFSTPQPWHPSNPAPPVIDRPAHPNTIRFSVLGQVIDEDSLYRFPRADQPVEEVHGGGSAAAGGGAMSSGLSSEAEPAVPPTPADTLPPPGTPEVP